MTLWWKEAWCPYCQAPPGQHCVSKTGKRVAIHADRHAEGAYLIFEGYGSYEDDEYDPGDVLIAPPTYRSMITVYLPGDDPRDNTAPA